MKPHFFISIAILSALLLVSGCAHRDYLKANRELGQFDYSKAESYYNSAFEKLGDTNRRWKNKAMASQAYSLHQTNRYKEAEAVFEATNLTGKGVPALYTYYYAQNLQVNGKCTEAVEYANKYLKRKRGKNEADLEKEAKKLIQSCETNPGDTLYNVKLISLLDKGGSDINALSNEYSAFSPVLNTDGKMVFTSNLGRSDNAQHDWTQMPYFDVCIAEGDSSVYENIQRIDTLDEKYHDGPATFTADGQTMYFTRSDYVERIIGTAYKLDRSDDNISRLKLYRSEMKDGKWELPVEMGEPFNRKNFSYGHPAMSPDGSRMYFISDDPELTPGSHKGLTDIYYWDFAKSKVFNAGPKVNTAERDMFPFVGDEEGSGRSWLYFSSKGHGGAGGLDIFRLDLNNDGAELDRLPLAINTSFDDFGVYITNHSEEKFSGYLSSNRDNEKGIDKIYTFEPPPVKKDSLIRLIGKVTDCEYGAAIPGADVALLESPNRLLFNSRTNNEGGFEFDLEFSKLYTVTASKEEFSKDSVEVSTITYTPVRVDTINLGDSIIFEIYVECKLELCKTGPPCFMDPAERYLVQVTAPHRPIQMKRFEGLDSVYLGVTCFNVFIYYSGPFNFDQAKVALQKSIDKGFAYARIVDRCDLQICFGEEVESEKLRHIFFDFDKSDLRGASIRQLDKLVSYMNKNPLYTVRLQGNTDAKGSVEYNKRLAERRISSAQKYLLRKGVNKKRIDEVVYGEEVPIAINQTKDGRDSPAGRQLNRRVDLIVLDQNGKPLSDLVEDPSVPPELLPK